MRVCSVLGLTAVLLTSNEAFAESFSRYDTGDHSEKITSLSGDCVKQVLYSYQLPSIALNDILIVDGETEISNGNGGPGSPAQLAAQLILGDSAVATTGVELDENNTFNITAAMHHGVRIKGSIKGFPAGSSNSFVNFVVWSCSNITLNVEQDYGRLQILQISP